MKKFKILLLIIISGVILSGCAGIELPTPEAAPKQDALPTQAVEAPPPEPTAPPEEIAEINARCDELIAEAEALRLQYRYEDAISLLAVSSLTNEEIEDKLARMIEEKNSLVNYTGDIPHIFFHSALVYPEMRFFDRSTPLYDCNSGFSEKQEIEKMLPQLYERGYVLYDLNRIWTRVDGVMVRENIMLPPGKTPLILSVDDVAYAYGDGFAQKLTVGAAGQLLYEVKNPNSSVDIMPDGDVMGIVDEFVKEHPDFAYQGHKGTIALTGYQGAFGYSYDIPEEAEQMRTVVAALKNDGWNFASHSYTHNRGNGYFGPGCCEEKVSYDINKWCDKCVPCLGETRLFIAPFGYRVRQPMLQHILDRGFDIYCTVEDRVYNELNPDYALMSRIEIGGYSMTYWKDMINELFFNVDEVFDTSRPPVPA